MVVFESHPILQGKRVKDGLSDPRVAECRIPEVESDKGQMMPRRFQRACTLILKPAGLRKGERIEEHVGPAPVKQDPPGQVIADRLKVKGGGRVRTWYEGEVLQVQGGDRTIPRFDEGENFPRHAVRVLTG